ncbi:uncharacterized protein LOC116618508 [Nematostella vectensis]|uniref:uncharacterized protein LOC116618508 n=1 Tax=Nematostella vectensis TaxID=45351 RepID=UPI002076E25F|nr:uncharacterized protein LOC116618508 [Nematostella vectensis]
MHSFLLVTLVLSILIQAFGGINGNPIAVETRSVCPVSTYDGCFKDYRNARTLPMFLFQERNETDPKYNGQLINWNEYGTYLSGLVCRCAEKAKEAKQPFFGIQFYGECFAGNNTTYKKKTVNDCTCESGHCAGEADANAVYILATSTTTAPTTVPAPPNSSCEDGPECIGFEDSCETYEAVRKQCPKMCGLCHV